MPILPWFPLLVAFGLILIIAALYSLREDGPDDMDERAEALNARWRDSL